MDRRELIAVLAVMQWEKVKGELLSLLAIAGSNKSTQSFAGLSRMDSEINSFILLMEAEIL